MVNSFFELNIVRLDNEDKIYNDERIRFNSLVEAQNEMLRVSKNPDEFNKEPIFCFIIREIPLGVLCINGDDDCLTERVYKPDGTLLDERLFPSGCLVGIFYGRLESQIRFREGDAVKVLDLVNKRIWNGFVCAVPPTVDEIMKLYEDNLPPYRLDSSDDSYIVLDRPLSQCTTDDDYMESHSHISALRLFPDEYLMTVRCSPRGA